MSFRIETLGRFRAYGPDDPEPIPFRTNGRILAYIAIQPNAIVNRKQIAATLWPDVEFSVSGNRLRVALTKLRELFGSALIDTQDSIGLNQDLVEIDIRNLRRSIKHAQDAIGAAEELQAMEAKLETLKSHLLIDIDDDWAEQAKQDWSREMLAATVRLAELAYEQENLEYLRQACQAGFAHEPYDETLWTLNLKALATLGHREEALREFNRAAKTYRTELDLEFSDELQDLVKDIRSGQFQEQKPSNSLSVIDREFGGLVVEALVEKNPSLVLQIFAADELAGLCGRYPERIISILDRVILTPSAFDETWEKCMIRLMRAKSWISDWEGSVAMSALALKHNQNITTRRSILNCMSFAQASIRDWTGAMEAVDEAFQLSLQMGDPILICGSRTNKASYLWQQGRFDEAAVLFDESIETLRQLDSPFAQTELAYLLGNSSFVPLMQGNFAAARPSMEEARAMCLKLGITAMDAVALPCLGMLRISDGILEGSVDLIHQGMREAYRSNAYRFQQISLEYASGALILLGEGPVAKAVLDWVDNWRNETKHDRCPAEIMLCEGLISRIPLGQEEFKFSSDADARKIAHFVIQMLRKREKEAGVGEPSGA